MQNLNTSIIIIGKICAGKSTLANSISSKLGYPIASFGGYLVNFSKENNLQTDRKSLQNLGTDLINGNHKRFLKEVINNVPNDKTNLIFEGVRHKKIFEEIKCWSQKSLSLYLDVDMCERLKRFLRREKEIDLFVTENDFYDRENHEVEKEIQGLKDSCDYIISNNEEASNVLKLVLD